MTYLPEVLGWAVVVMYAYLFLVYCMIGTLVIVAVGENTRLAREERHEEQEILSRSRQTIPVSIIAPAYNEAVVIAASVGSMLAIDYPEFEVIVVNDGSKDGTLHELIRTFDLRRRDVPLRRVFDTQEVRGIYVSETYPNLRVIDKNNGGKADALNCGINFARYRYLCTVDGDTVFLPDALLEGMRIALKDPSLVVGVTSQVAINQNPEAVLENRAAPARGESLLTQLQQLDYLRAFVNGRVAWSRLDFMLCSVGAFAIWRRDVVEEVGGFSGAFTCEDIEFTFRVHEHFRRLKRPYRILSLAKTVGRTEGPDTVRALVSQRARWQRVITETVWHYRRMFLNPRYGVVGMLGMPYYVMTEVLAPFFQVASVVTLPLVWWLGLFTPVEFVLFLLVVMFANGVITNAALVMHDQASRFHTPGQLKRLMLLGPVELLWYRPVIFWAQAKGMVGFFRGDKSWNKFDRNQRGPVV